ncbi:hypothetical protein [Nocardia sp. NBC_01327]|uniref:hypothetical protein n=1 Tax=Nocardia sp. NBC_01327 TaxID=2903593 RepID=UPI002E137C93|nr:hypothetical protein OG326_08035 [Nocardia sp. NBC_01327]
MTSPIRRRGVRGEDEGAGVRGAKTYTGQQIHCTRWPAERDLRGQHVAVVGGGPAVARVLPAVVARARRVTVFQHDPVWVLPAPPVPGMRQLLRSLPEDLLGLLPADTAPPLPGSAPAGDTAVGGENAVGGESALRSLTMPLRWLTHEVLRRTAAVNLRVQVRDSWQRRQLTPDTAAGVRLHNNYYRALRQPNCLLITWPIARLAPLGIRTVDGVEHRVDCIIYAEDMP